MLTPEELEHVIGGTAYSREGEKIGRIGNVYVDDETGQPQFLSVTTGLFGTNQTFVPAAEAERDGDRVTVPFAKESVKDAPNVRPDHGHLDLEDERRIFDFYGLQYSVNPAYGSPPGPPRMRPVVPVPPGPPLDIEDDRPH